MQTNTFTEAVELVYAEAWRLGDRAEKARNGEIRFSGGEANQERGAQEYWREYLGAQHALGVLLHARGEVGLRSAPMTPETKTPDVQQVWIRLMQWGISKGLEKQEFLDEILENSPQHKRAMEMLGQDFLASEEDVRRVRELVAETA